MKMSELNKSFHENDQLLACVTIAGMLYKTVGSMTSQPFLHTHLTFLPPTTVMRCQKHKK